MNYLSRYPESDQMHKRMLYVSERIRDFEDSNPEAGEKIKEAKKLYEQRVSEYKKVADVIVSVDKLSQKEVLEEIAKAGGIK